MAFIFSTSARDLATACATHPTCQTRLSPGADWLLPFNLGAVDRSDAQWSMFRQQLPLLGGVAPVFLALSAAARASKSRTLSLVVYCAAGVGFLVIVIRTSRHTCLRGKLSAKARRGAGTRQRRRGILCAHRRPELLHRAVLRPPRPRLAG